jgi:hypothetical protein
VVTSNSQPFPSGAGDDVVTAVPVAPRFAPGADALDRSWCRPVRFATVIAIAVAVPVGVVTSWSAVATVPAAVVIG